MIFIAKTTDENFVSGSIPNEFMSGIPALQKIQMHGNRLIGRIPNIHSLSKLEMLDLQGNELTGDFDFEYLINSAATLKILKLCFNSFSGAITNRLDEFVNLEELCLDSSSNVSIEET